MAKCSWCGKSVDHNRIFDQWEQGYCSQKCLTEARASREQREQPAVSAKSAPARPTSMRSGLVGCLGLVGIALVIGALGGKSIGAGVAAAAVLFLTYKVLPKRGA